MNLCHHYADCNFKATWNFFATGHEKPAVDRIGGTIKQLTPKASFQRQCNDQILSA